MPLTPAEIAYGVVVPAAVAAALFFLLRRLSPADSMSRYAASVAVVGGLLVSNGLLELAPWVATNHWHWLTYVALAAALIGPIGLAAGVGWLERGLLRLLFALVAAWFLVPSWEDLEPARSVYVPIFATLLTAHTLLFEPLEKRMPGPSPLILVCLAMAGGAVILGLSESLRFAQLGGAATAALGGCAVVACMSRAEYPMRGASAVVSLLLVGLMMIGRVNSFSDVPLASYGLIPLAPLCLWAFVSGPGGRLSGWKRGLAQTAAVLLPIVIAILLALPTESGEDEWSRHTPATDSLEQFVAPAGNV